MESTSSILMELFVAACYQEPAQSGAVALAAAVQKLQRRHIDKELALRLKPALALIYL